MFTSIPSESVQLCLTVVYKVSLGSSRRRDPSGLSEYDPNRVFLPYVFPHLVVFGLPDC